MSVLMQRIRAYLFPWAIDERAVIDQGAYYDAAHTRLARIKAIDKKRHRVATLVGGWASSTVAARDRAKVPSIIGSPCRRIHAWLPGLSVAEIMKLKESPTIDIAHHLFEDHAIIGVRPVQPLEPALLFWPRPTLNTDQQQTAAGGGPRKR